MEAFVNVRQAALDRHLVPRLLREGVLRATGRRDRCPASVPTPGTKHILQYRGIPSSALDRRLPTCDLFATSLPSLIRLTRR